jgi:hypothetical protein
MITAYLVGDAEVLARVRAIPSAVSTGLVQTITKLGLDLQQRVQQKVLSGQSLGSRGGLSTFDVDLKLDESSDRISATISSGSEYTHAHGYGRAGTVDVRASLQRERRSFRRPISAKAINPRANNRKMALPEYSFLRSALEEMGSEIPDEIETAVREALT